jgi:hypothetical protein
MGTNSIDLALGVGLGDQLYSHEILEPGLVKMKASSRPWLSVGQQRPRLDGGAMIYL